MKNIKLRFISLSAAVIVAASLCGCDSITAQTPSAVNVPDVDEIDSLIISEPDTDEVDSLVSSETGSAADAESETDETDELEGPYEVAKVVDGDTIKLIINGEKKNVRLIGVDTPESVHPDASKNVPEGKLASDHTKELVGDNQLYIKYGTEPADRYGRPLCYVYLPDGTMLNEQILRDGYAKVMIVGKNKEYKEKFTEIASEAKAEGRGLWSTGVFDD
ncbi:MAG: thermonuclease family protein [Clostridia bacterium]|nr:thermonuclease family protein [Clostridia bacterium]